ncbi:hypothetical protein BDZ97DRAFT_1839052 [Flammula alnicola]|nr:hypothetical protein BDZ97DRAFT_1839052 [Flammula alnicola]
MASLCPGALQSCIIGRANFVSSFLLETTRLLVNHRYIPSDECHDVQVCNNASQVFFAELIERSADENKILFPVDWSTFDFPEEETFCKECGSNINRAFNTSQQTLWHNLPVHFQLPEWEKIRDFDS